MTKELSKIEQLSQERKQSVIDGWNPDWINTPGYQLLKSSYFTEDEPNLKLTFKRIAKVLSKHASKEISEQNDWENRFFKIMWKGDLIPSTPVLSSCGTNKGLVVSCCANYVDDSVKGFYDATSEMAVLSQEGFGTASYLGDIRPRGSAISRGGKASGVLPVIQQFVQMARDITQGTRRGAWAGYLPIEHGDFLEVVNYLEHNPEDLNLGWLISDSFIEKLKQDDPDALLRYKRALKVKLVTGKGYFVFNDKANRSLPQFMKDQGLEFNGSQLCTEIVLPNNKDLTYTCVLASNNLANYDNWDDDTIFVSTVFLDCVVSEFLEKARKKSGLEKVVRYTELFRSLGLGTLGFHTLLQKRSYAFDSIDTVYLNGEIYKKMQDESIKASKYLAEKLGEPEGLKGTGLRNSHNLAIAPNTSSSAIAGGVSQGIEPFYTNCFVQPLSSGEVNRVNPVLIPIMKERGVYNSKTIKELLFNEGSVQEVDWLNDHEKDVFKTAFEIDQHVLIRLAAQRQKFIDQGQSLNLFFGAGTDEEYISSVHRDAFLNENIKSLYYIRSTSSTKASSGNACSTCAN